MLALWGTRVGIDRDDWAYDLSISAVGAGLAGFVVYLVVYGALAVLFILGFGIEPSLTASGLGAGSAPTWALALLFLGNGIVAPIAEELAWRGVVQTALTDAYGTVVAVGVTALAFVANHLIVDRKVGSADLQ